MGLSDRDRAVLDFEGSWWIEHTSKADALKARLGLSRTRYRQILAVLADSAEAERYAPLVIRRLRRDRAQRRRARYERPLAGGRPQR
jgi:Protein of unknown function (DUF3263)